MLLAFLIVMAGMAVNGVSAYLAYVRLKTMRPVADLVDARVTVVVPVTGSSVDMIDLVRRLDRQTLRPARLIVAVESKDDPAYRQAVAAFAQTSLPCEIIVAGFATRQAQKCRNIQAALRLAHEDDGYLVFMDADIRPSIHWLSHLILPLDGGNFDLVTGRRWLVLEKSRLGSHLIAMIDRSIMALPRLDFDSTCTIWGGSYALSCANARALDLSRCIDDTLSDDLAIASQARLKQVRIVAPGSLLVPSPIDATLAQAWRFGRRQYKICRLYRPMLWRIASLIVVTRLVAWTAAVSLLASGYGPLPVLMLAATGLLKQVAIARIAHRCEIGDPPLIHTVQLLLGLFQPIADLFHLAVLLSVTWVRQLRWGHVTYSVDGPTSILVVGRAPFLD